MSTDSTANADRWEELQVTRLLFGLSPEEQTEYDVLAMKMSTDESDPLSRVVASIDVAWSTPRPEALPEHLRSAILDQAERNLLPKLTDLPRVSTMTRESSRRSQSYLPWFVAAACLALSIFLWISNRPGATPEASVAQLRLELMANASDLVQATWIEGTTPIAGATGDVVWSEQRQRGFLRFQGLPVNVPSQAQYQLWIFDKNQSDKTPIDGGVFDIRSDGEVVVLIDAKLRVREAFMFAVTIEKPGGVVVSSRERLPLLAKVE